MKVIIIPELNGDSKLSTGKSKIFETAAPSSNDDSLNHICHTYLSKLPYMIHDKLTKLLLHTLHYSIPSFSHTLYKQRDYKRCSNPRTIHHVGPNILTWPQLLRPLSCKRSLGKQATESWTCSWGTDSPESIVDNGNS